jgi:hypothetical protein
VELKLNVNGASLKTNRFVLGFIDNTVNGMIEALKGTSKVKDLFLSIEGDMVKIELNGGEIPINEFAAKIIRSTMVGMVSVLNGFDGNNGVDKLYLKIHEP